MKDHFSKGSGEGDSDAFDFGGVVGFTLFLGLNFLKVGKE